MIVTRIAPGPLGAVPEETVVTIWRIVRAQLIELLRCEVRPPCHVLYGLAFVRQQ